MIKKFFKYFGTVILIYTLLCLITPHNKFLRTRSIDNQINYLSKIIDKGYDNELQRRFPEGKIFSNCLLALSTIEFCDRNEKASEKYAKIVDRCIQRIQSKKALSIFSANMKPAYGMFYNGWANFVYTSYQESKLFKFSEIADEIIQESNKIQEQLIETQDDSLRILDTYIGSNWPGDNLIGILSLSDDSLKDKWIEKLIETSNHQSGLINHAGSNLSAIRGSSSALVTYCLSKLQYEYREAYNDKFTDVFVDNYLGIQLVKENEDGSNDMDFDSGPVVFGYGASATIMNIKTQASFGNRKARTTWGAMNLISLPMNIFAKKYYLFQQEPMLDLFMLWGSTEL